MCLNKKYILIIGKGSYIGESIYKWLDKYSEKYFVEIVSPLNNQWKAVEFSNYEIVIDLAGIAHINNITEDMRDLFYSVNRDLTIEIGKNAKENGVKHFIYFSSMNVYGDYCKEIVDRNKENPTSFYGDSKLQGDIGLRKLADNDFVVASIRPPFVYGNGCKGNYNRVSKIARKVPVFPTYRNKKSMIYIDNLCEFIRLLIEDGSGGIYTPQNKELVSTSDLVKEISKNNNHKILFTGVFNWTIPLGMKLIDSIKKAFTDDNYELALSDYYGFKYCVVDFKSSIRLTEQKRGSDNNNE